MILCKPHALNSIVFFRLLFLLMLMLILDEEQMFDDLHECDGGDGDDYATNLAVRVVCLF